MSHLREFQRAAVCAVNSLLTQWGIQPRWDEKRVGPFPALRYAADDVDVHTSFVFDGEPAEVWVHPDDLSVTILVR